MDIKYRLESIYETEFTMNSDFDFANFDPNKVKFKLGHLIEPSMQEDKIVIKADASLVCKEHDILLACNSITLVFGLSPIKKIIEIKDDGTLISKNRTIIDTFLITTIGALRGILMKNLKGTPLEQFHLPLIPIENSEF